MRSLLLVAATALLWMQATNALDLDISNQDSIKSAAKTVAQNLVQEYYKVKGNDIPGLLPSPPYFWGSAGVMWDSLVNYWYLTGDSQYNGGISEALLFQAGQNNDYMPANQSNSEGNNDQAAWALAALSAAERNFPAPPSGKGQWVDLATAVFNEQALRWDNSTCGGGIRWQILRFNNGYNYKQAPSWFFLLAARLGQLTGNQTYSDWAEKTYNWATTKLISDKFAVYDGASTTDNCTIRDPIEWSFNQAAFLYGSAVMYNMTSSDTWQKRVQGHLSYFTSVFFTSSASPDGNGNILTEVACEPKSTCDSDQSFYKGLASRWMAQAAVSAPFISSKVTPLLQASAQAAAASCNSTSDGAQCGMKWTTGSNDGNQGAGDQLSALEIFQQNLNGPQHALALAGSSSSINSTKPSGSSTGAPSGSPTSKTGAGAAVQVTWLLLVAGVFVTLL